VNVLSDQQRELSMRFAAGGADKFRGVSWAGQHTGCPVLEGTAAWFDCKVEQRVEAGDHVIFIARVLDFAASGAAPLGYCRGAYVPLALDHRLFQATGTTTRRRVGAIIEHKQAVLLQRDPATGRVSVPGAPSLGDEHKARSLLGRLARWGVHPQALFVFSVYDDTDVHHVLYRGELAGIDAPPPGDDRHGFFAFDEIPWERMEARTRRTLERYIRERRADAFGVFVGNAKGGTVQALR
jgi:hypothetical protein